MRGPCALVTNIQVLPMTSRVSVTGYADADVATADNKQVIWLTLEHDDA